MAVGPFSRVATRAAVKVIKSATAAATPSASKASSCSALPRQQRRLSRLCGRVGCVESLLPLHSAVAAARMTSCLTSASRDCRALSQELGLSVPR